MSWLLGDPGTLTARWRITRGAAGIPGCSAAKERGLPSAGCDHRSWAARMQAGGRLDGGSTGVARRVRGGCPGQVPAGDTGGTLTYSGEHWWDVGILAPPRALPRWVAVT